MPRIMPEFITIAPNGDAQHADARFAKVTGTDIDTIFAELPGTHIAMSFSRETGHMTGASLVPVSLAKSSTVRIIQKDLDAYANASTFCIPECLVGKLEARSVSECEIVNAARMFVDDVLATHHRKSAGKGNPVGAVRIGFEVLDPPELRTRAWGADVAAALRADLAKVTAERDGAKLAAAMEQESTRELRAYLEAHHRGVLNAHGGKPAAAVLALLKAASLKAIATAPGHTPMPGAGGTPLIPPGKVYCEDADLETVAPTGALERVTIEHKARAREFASRIADCYMAPRVGLPIQRWGGALSTICATIATHSLLLQYGWNPADPANAGMVKAYDEAKQMLREFSERKIELVVEGTTKLQPPNPSFSVNGLPVDFGKTLGIPIDVGMLTERLRKGGIPVDIVVFDADLRDPGQLARDVVATLGRMGKGEKLEPAPTSHVILGDKTLPPHPKVADQAVRVDLYGEQAWIHCEFHAAVKKEWDALIQGLSLDRTYGITHPVTGKAGIDKVKLVAIGPVHWNVPASKYSVDIVGVKHTDPKPAASATPKPATVPLHSATNAEEPVITSANLVFAFEFYSARGTYSVDPYADTNHAERLAKHAVEVLSRNGALDAAAELLVTAFEAECSL